MTIRPPQAWIWDKISDVTHPPSSLSAGDYWTDVQPVTSVPPVRRIGVAELRSVLKQGIDDFAACRTDVLFICVFYPLIGLLLARLASGYHLLPLIFPLISGFALVGPFAAVWLNEMSRRREMGLPISLANSAAVLRSPALGRILALGLGQIFLLFLWLIAAEVIYDATLGPDAPVSARQFLNDVLTTVPGWTMIGVGLGVGFLFALLVLTVSAVAFPMLLDRDVPVDIAVRTSIRVALTNKLTIAVWGLIVAAALVVGSLPALLGLIVVMPVLGHATWHLYRATVPR